MSMEVNEVAGALAGIPPLSSWGLEIIGPKQIKLPLQRDSKKVAFTLENVLSAEDA